MRNLIASWRASPPTLSDYRRSLVLDILAAAAIVVYIAASYSGPPPAWAKMAYLVGIVACGASSSIRRRWFSLACIAVLTAIAAEQVISGEWLMR